MVLENNPEDIDTRPEIRRRLSGAGFNADPIDTRGEAINHFGFLSGRAQLPASERERTDAELAIDIERTLAAGEEMGVEFDDPAGFGFDAEWFDGDDL